MHFGTSFACQILGAEKQKDGSVTASNADGNFADEERAHKPKTSCKSSASIRRTSLGRKK